jgi:dihydrofolate reductase
MIQGMSETPPDFQKLKEYIFSTTLDKVKDGAILIKDNIKKEVEKIKNDSSASSEGKDIWLFGGAGLTASLINLGLIDELSLAVHQIILGAGKPLFSNINGRIHLKLIDSKTYSTGLVRLKYQLGQK